jgi:hypothetical protein
MAQGARREREEERSVVSARDIPLEIGSTLNEYCGLSWAKIKGPWHGLFLKICSKKWLT